MFIGPLRPAGFLGHGGQALDILQASGAGCPGRVVYFPFAASKRLKPHLWLIRPSGTKSICIAFTFPLLDRHTVGTVLKSPT